MGSELESDLAQKGQDPEITALFSAWRSGDEDAGDALFSRVYAELRRLAEIQLRGQAGSPTLGTTALVNEAYLKLSGAKTLDVADRGHFFCLAARAMRQILVDHARRWQTAKRGDGRRPLQLEPHLIAVQDSASDLLALDQALDQLSSEDEDLARIVELRFFAGLSIDETALATDRSSRTVKRQWRLARAFLYQRLAPEQHGPSSSIPPVAEP